MNLFILGLGYSGIVFARRKLAEGWRVLGTVRSPEKAKALRAEGIEAFTFDARAGDLGTAASAFHEAEALLVSIPPAGENDPLPETLSRPIAEGGAFAGSAIFPRSASMATMTAPGWTRRHPAALHRRGAGRASRPKQAGAASERRHASR
jgi:hypothetical protein